MASLTRAARGVGARALPVAGLGLALAGASWFVPLRVLSLGLLLSGLTLVFLAILARLLLRQEGQGQGALAHSAARLCDADENACVLTDAAGEVLYANEAAQSGFGAREGEPLAGALGAHFASPAALLYRLQGRAEAQGHASEDVVLRRGGFRVSATRVSPGAILWRLQDTGDRGIASRSGDSISLPMMTVSASGTILFMNEALRRILGGRQTALDRVVDTLPISHGTVARLAGKEGSVKTLVCEIQSTAGRRELYFLPDLKASAVSSEDWGVVETLPVALVKLDAEGLVLNANRGARDLLRAQSLTGGRLSDLVEGLGRPVSEWLREAAAGRVDGKSEVARAIGEGEDRFLQISLARAIEPDGPVIIAVLQDATALKSMEAQFVQSQKMQAIGQLAGGVAHDFNNLLTAISGHCDLLLLRHAENDPDFADLDQIRQNANRAASLVAHLLAFSRKQTLRPEAVDLEEALADLAHLLNRLTDERTQLVVSHGRNVMKVRADKRQLEQVLVNLVVNARDAMPDGGEIRIETANLSLDEPLRRDRATVLPGDYVSIKVTDEGIGIPEDVRERIFEPFFTTKGAGKGTGLGLSMAYGIVKQSGGFIFVDSTPGAGTTFWLLFPSLAETAEEPQELREIEPEMPAASAEHAFWEVAGFAPDRSCETGGESSIDEGRAAESSDLSADPYAEDGAPPPDRSEDVVARVQAAARGDGLEPELPRPTHEIVGAEGGNLLLVEDEAPVRAFAARALRMRGYTVIEAESAERALELLSDRSLHIDIFVSDIIMPGMDGPTWVAEALVDRPHVKVVFVSGYSEEAVSAHQARIPNAVFLPKPFSLSELTAIVHSQLH